MEKNQPFFFSSSLFSAFTGSDNTSISLVGWFVGVFWLVVWFTLSDCDWSIGAEGPCMKSPNPSSSSAGRGAAKNMHRWH